MSAATPLATLATLYAALGADAPAAQRLAAVQAHFSTAQCRSITAPARADVPTVPAEVLVCGGGSLHALPDTPALAQFAAHAAQSVQPGGYLVYDLFAPPPSATVLTDDTGTRWDVLLCDRPTLLAYQRYCSDLPAQCVTVQTTWLYTTPASPRWWRGTHTATLTWWDAPTVAATLAAHGWQPLAADAAALPAPLGSLGYAVAMACKKP